MTIDRNWYRTEDAARRACVTRVRAAKQDADDPTAVAAFDATLVALDDPDMLQKDVSSVHIQYGKGRANVHIQYGKGRANPKAGGKFAICMPTRGKGRPSWWRFTLCFAPPV